MARQARVRFGSVENPALPCENGIIEIPGTRKCTVNGNDANRKPLMVVKVVYD